MNIRQVGFQHLKKIIRENDLKFVGFEADHVSVSQLEIFEDAFDTALIPTQNIVEKIREVKDEGEIQTIREACRISDAAFLHILDFIKPGVRAKSKWQMN